MTSTSNQEDFIQLTSVSGLHISATTSATSILDTFYRDYDSAFVLANEKEGYEGFKECLQLNAGAAYEQLSRRYGLFREFVLIARDAAGARVGGANLICFPLDTGEPGDVPVLSINLNYIFINQDQRKRGMFRQLVQDLPDIAFRLLLANASEEVPPSWQHGKPRQDEYRPKTLMFIEQNDPLRMSAEDYQRDTEYTGLDQMSRIHMWARLGAKVIDFPYVQPPLTSSQEADPNLVYAILGAEGDSLSASLLHEHLQRFFGISVLKGQDVMQNSHAGQQLTLLRELNNSGKQLALLRAEPQHSSPAPGATSLREVLRQHAGA